MRKMAQAEVFISGMDGLGVEIGNEHGCRWAWLGVGMVHQTMWMYYIMHSPPFYLINALHTYSITALVFSFINFQGDEILWIY